MPEHSCFQKWFCIFLCNTRNTSIHNYGPKNRNISYAVNNNNYKLQLYLSLYQWRQQYLNDSTIETCIRNSNIIIKQICKKIYSTIFLFFSFDLLIFRYLFWRVSRTLGITQTTPRLHSKSSNMYSMRMVDIETAIGTHRTFFLSGIKYWTVY